jgi:hypothetical protein
MHEGKRREHAGPTIGRSADATTVASQLQRSTERLPSYSGDGRTWRLRAVSADDEVDAVVSALDRHRMGDCCVEPTRYFAALYKRITIAVAVAVENGAFGRAGRSDSMPIRESVLRRAERLLHNEFRRPTHGQKTRCRPSMT